MPKIFIFCVATLIAISAGSQSASYAQAVKLSGADLLCNGESFFAASNIASELTRLARADGVLASNESFNQVAVSGVPIATVFNQFKNANPKPKFLVTDGGGIDLMSNTCKVGDTNCAMIQNLKTTMQEYIAEMKKDGVKAFLWMCYPDPQGTNWATLKTGQDIWAVEAKKVVDATTSPKPLWVDLRPIWAGHYSEYTSDGIHCTTAGGTATAIAFWNAMKANNYAFFDGTSKPVLIDNMDFEPKTMHSFLRGKTVTNKSLTVSVFLVKSAVINIHVTTMSGKAVVSAENNEKGSGLQSVTFPLGSISPGVYCIDVKSVGIEERSLILMR